MKQVKKTVLYFLLLYLVIVAGLYVFQRNLTYYPDKIKPDITPYVADGVREVEVWTADGIPLTGWYKPAEKGKDTIVIFHGNASNHLGSIYKAAPYIRDGYGFLSAGYRGYSGNDGKPTEEGFYEDARAWVDFLKTQVREQTLILYGESIGTGVAVQMATEYRRVKALVLESPYTSLPDVAFTTYFFVPVHLLMKDRYDSLSKIDKVKAPLLVMQGTKDKIVPPRLGQKLFAAANEPKDIQKFDAHGHNDLPPEELAARVRTFIGSLD